MKLLKYISVFAFGAAAFGATATAADETDDQSVFVFGGRYHTGHMEHILNPLGPFGLDYEDNYVAGGGYQQFFLENGDVRVGVEAGAAIGFGADGARGEVWGGLVGRYEGLEFGDVNIAPSLTLGASAITNTIGIESDRVAPGADPHVLFYIAPEIAVSHDAHPETEVFFRIQHRSGAWETLNGMGDGHNASTVGLRWKF
jgi:hypothetical protein